MPSWAVTKDNNEIKLPEGCRLNLFFTSQDDLIKFIAGIIQPVAKQFNLDVVVKKREGIEVVRPG